MDKRKFGRINSEVTVLAIGGAGLGEGGSGGDSVVAPVREMPGQVLSVLWAMAPKCVQKECLQVLVRMSSRNEWEVRHGSLQDLYFD